MSYVKRNKVVKHAHKSRWFADWPIIAFFYSFSCIDIYSHSCLKPFSIGRKPCSNNKSHGKIKKFTCRFNMGFGRRHCSIRRDVAVLSRNKMTDVEAAPRFSVSFYVVNVIFKIF